MGATLEALMEVYDFTAEDLAANREGRFSERQRKNLSPGRWSDVFMTGCLALANIGACTIVPGGPAVIFMRQYRAEGVQWVLWASVGLGVLAVVGFVFGVWVVMRERGGRMAQNAANLHDLGEGRVLAAAVTIEMDEGDEHYYAVNKREGVMVYADAPIVKPGERYTAYYTPEGNLLLSMEPR